MKYVQVNVHQMLWKPHSLSHMKFVTVVWKLSLRYPLPTRTNLHSHCEVKNFFVCCLADSWIQSKEASIIVCLQLQVWYKYDTSQHLDYLQLVIYFMHAFMHSCVQIIFIPRACFLSRSPVPAVDLKSNRSDLWRHMLEMCRRLRRLCRKCWNNVAQHDKTPVKSTLLSCNKNILSRDMIKLQLV